MEEKKFNTISPVSRKTIGTTYGATHCKKCACGTLYITTNLDKDGNFLRTVTSRGNATGQSASALTGKKIAKTAGGNSTYDGLVIEDLTDVDGESTGTTIFRDPATGNMIYRGRIRGANTGEGKDYVIPSSISTILNRYPDF